MTADPAIRAALREGARARCCGDAACHYEDSGLPCPMIEQVQRDADIIAAFLRALPDQYSRGGAAFWDAIPAEEETRLWLAAAVEAAAREAGE